jgi:HlyD family secretion protein
MKKKLILLAVLLTIIVIVVISFKTKSKGEREIIVELKRESFEITVANSGELEAKNSVPILGPDRLVAARVWSIKIEDIVEEGTIVKKGEYVATLDRTEIGERIRSEELDGEESLNNFESTQIDTALDLRGRRDELKKKLLNVERKKLELRNSQYEPPATIQQAELTLKEAEMDHELATEDYILRKEKATTSMKRRSIDLIDDREDLKMLTSLYDQFIIYAPENGMVIYRRDHGNKVKKGSSISTRNPIIATLPDLTKMLSRCFVNEVDIRLISVGQKVRIGIDAYPEKRLTGTIRKIANVGESLPYGDAKVFAVEVEVNESDEDLKPGMTTSNEIIIQQEPEILALPLECLHNAGDSLSYVFIKNGLQTIKKEITVGQSNSNKIIVKVGLEDGDRVLLNIPPSPENLKFQYIN